MLSMPNYSFAVFCPFYVHMSQFLHLTGVCHLGGLAVQDKFMGVKKVDQAWRQR